MSGSTSKRYPAELRERAVRMVGEVRAEVLQGHGRPPGGSLVPTGGLLFPTSLAVAETLLSGVVSPVGIQARP